VYVRTKGALAGVTKGFAPKLGRGGATVNSVQPGRRDPGMNAADGESAKATSQASSRLAIEAPMAREASVSGVSRPATAFENSGCIRFIRLDLSV
jgi:NAD(P)-dependent dehydrogenase (short-subunit alcohol dehydrogenase family)